MRHYWNAEWGERAESNERGGAVDGDVVERVVAMADLKRMGLWRLQKPAEERVGVKKVFLTATPISDPRSKKISNFILPPENLDEVGQFRAKNNTILYFWGLGA
jgi:hypothetical protein